MVDQRAPAANDKMGWLNPAPHARAIGDRRDRIFGPFFIKFCSYFPYFAKLCLNGHEYLKCQLTLHVYYINTHLKQYHKEGRALRTETTINNTYDFGVGRRLHNLPKPREIGFAANRRVLEVEKITHDCHLGTKAFQKLQQPIQVETA